MSAELSNNSGELGDVQSGSPKRRKSVKSQLFGFSPEQLQSLVAEFRSTYHKRIIHHGKLYIYPSVLCFLSNTHHTTARIPLLDIAQIKKKKNALTPTAIEVTTKSGDKFFFSHLNQRERTYQTIIAVWALASGDESINIDEIRKAKDSNSIKQLCASSQFFQAKQSASSGNLSSPNSADFSVSAPTSPYPVDGISCDGVSFAVENLSSFVSHPKNNFSKAIKSTGSINHSIQTRSPLHKSDTTPIQPNPEHSTPTESSDPVAHPVSSSTVPGSPKTSVQNLKGIFNLKNLIKPKVSTEGEKPTTTNEKISTETEKILIVNDVKEPTRKTTNFWYIIVFLGALLCFCIFLLMLQSSNYYTLQQMNLKLSSQMVDLAMMKVEHNETFTSEQFLNELQIWNDKIDQAQELLEGVRKGLGDFTKPKN